jgi:hypothetical protein
MASRKIEWDEITPEVICEWAYDEEAYLISQDEDLLLYKWELLPVMLELIADSNCPKRQWIYFALCQFTRESVTRRGKAGQIELSHAIASLEPPTEEWQADWYAYTQRVLGYMQPTGAVDRETAACMAKDLLLGIAGRVGEITAGSEESPGWLRFTLQTSVTEHIDVCLATGDVRYTPWY